MVSQDTPAILAASAARFSTLVACFLICSACLVNSSDICRTLDSRTPNTLNGASTTITDTLAPTDFASDNPFVTACSASSEPSVGMRICRYMFHLSIVKRAANVGLQSARTTQSTAAPFQSKVRLLI